MKININVAFAQKIIKNIAFIVKPGLIHVFQMSAL